MKHKIISLSFLIIFLGCSKAEDNLADQLIEEEEPQIYSCVSYDELLDPQNTDANDLMQYWHKFVDDVKCSRGGPDYDERNVIKNIFFEFRTAAQITAGVTPDHIAYSTFSGYCNDSVVNVGVLFTEWNEKNLLQRLWIMYHEFIVKDKSKEYTQLKKYLNNYEGKKFLKSSSKKKFLSLTFEFYANSPTDVINIYKGIEHIDNIISL